MKRSAFDKTADQVSADRPEYPKGYTPDLMCIAHGCPNRWTVDAGSGRLCSAHAWEPMERWPEITQHQQWSETDRARMRGNPTLVAPQYSHEQKRSILRRLRDVLDTAKNPRAWIDRLKARGNAGERFTIAQRTALHDVRNISQIADGEGGES